MHIYYDEDYKRIDKSRGQTMKGALISEAEAIECCNVRNESDLEEWLEDHDQDFCPITVEDFIDEMLYDGWWGRVSDLDVHPVGNTEPDGDFESCRNKYFIYEYYYDKATDEFFTIKEMYKNFLDSGKKSFVEYLSTRTYTYGFNDSDTENEFWHELNYFESWN